MATNIDKALYQQPTGIDALGRSKSPIEIEIVDPEEVTIGMDAIWRSPSTPEKTTRKKASRITWPST
jgi:hypothetical protein